MGPLFVFRKNPVNTFTRKVTIKSEQSKKRVHKHTETVFICDRCSTLASLSLHPLARSSCTATQSRDSAHIPPAITQQLVSFCSHVYHSYFHLTPIVHGRAACSHWRIMRSCCPWKRHKYVCWKCCELCSLC